jgi:hypothetical protein
VFQVLDSLSSEILDEPFIQIIEQGIDSKVSEYRFEERASFIKMEKTTSDGEFTFDLHLRRVIHFESLGFSLSCRPRIEDEQSLFPCLRL